MKKVTLCLVAATILLLTACAEKTTEISVSQKYQDVLQSYNLADIAESFVETEEGTIVYTISEKVRSTMSEETETQLETNIEEFIANIKEQNADIIIDIAFSEDGTVLEGTVTDAAGSSNGMLFLILPSYPDIVLMQILAGIEPTGITFKMTDAETSEVFEQEIPF